MAILDKYKWTILYTDYQKEFIHLKHIINSNPYAQIITVNTSHNLRSHYAWRNCDSLVRQYLKSHISDILYNNIAIFSWDVLITQELPRICVDGLMATNVFNQIQRPRWPWFREISKLGKYKASAFAAAPFCVYFMNKNAINVWLDPQFDHLYEQDIFSELRFPTILNSQNISINKYDFPYVHWNKTHLTKNPGIYHPIKYNVL